MGFHIWGFIGFAVIFGIAACTGTDSIFNKLIFGKFFLFSMIGSWVLGGVIGTVIEESMKGNK